MSRPSIIFVDGLSTGLTQKDKSINKSRVQAHAAFYTHQRRLKLQTKISIPSPQCLLAAAPRTVRAVHRPSSRLDSFGQREESSLDPANAANERVPGAESETVVSEDDHQGIFAQGSASEDDVDADEVLELAHFSDKSPWPGFGHFRTEAFNVNQHWMGKETMNAMDFYLRVIAPEYDRVSELFNITNADRLLLQLSSHRIVFHAWIALLVYVAEQMISPGSEPSKHVLRQRGIALNLLIDGIQSSTMSGDLILYAVMFNALLERTLGNDTGHFLHVRTLKRIILERQKLDGSLQDIGRSVGLIYGPEWNRPVNRATPTKDTEISLASPPIDPVYVSVLPVGFQKLAAEAKLRHDTLVLLTRAANLGFSSRSSIQPMHFTRNRRRVRPYNSIFDACPALESDDYSEFILDKLICLAIITFSHTAFGTHRTGPTTVTFRAARTDLTRLLPIVAATTHHARTKRCVMIWLFILAMEAWRISDPDHKLMPEGRMLLLELRKLYSGMVPAWYQMKTIVSRFFWSDILDDIWSASWDQFNQDILRERSGDSESPGSMSDGGGEISRRRIGAGTPRDWYFFVLVGNNALCD